MRELKRFRNDERNIKRILKYLEMIRQREKKLYHQSHKIVVLLSVAEIYIQCHSLCGYKKQTNNEAVVLLRENEYG